MAATPHKTAPKAPKKVGRNKSRRLSNHPWIQANITQHARRRTRVGRVTRFTHLTDFGLDIVVLSAAEVLDYIGQDLPHDIDYSEFKVWWKSTKRNYGVLVDPYTLTILVEQYQTFCTEQQLKHKLARDIMSEYNAFSNVLDNIAEHDRNQQTTSRKLIDGEVKKSDHMTNLYGKCQKTAADLDANKDQDGAAPVNGIVITHKQLRIAAGVLALAVFAAVAVKFMPFIMPEAVEGGGDADGDEGNAKSNILSKASDFFGGLLKKE